MSRSRTCVWGDVICTSGTVHKEEKPYTLRIGSLLLHNIGQLLPYQIQTNKFNTRDCIYPVGFETTRYYWSYRLVNQRCRYRCRIDDNEGRPEFVIRVIEEGFTDEVEFKGNTPKGTCLCLCQLVPVHWPVPAFGQ
ncbi:hypothetical protein NP493_1078g02011 [Ridgeia piscesae]|uniref:Uncharacterized protein n=1 Tax=Ridgeia piscesae TaxID=27915 RepID=A0AAD9NJY9_RIDPI|nr:hypothetical protein NP493_1078g02011 [Ridgeia piscesae]